MKYPLDKQFRLVSHLHLPLQKWMAAPSQLMLRALPRRSGKDTAGQGRRGGGPGGCSALSTFRICPR